MLAATPAVRPAVTAELLVSGRVSNRVVCQHPPGARSAVGEHPHRLADADATDLPFGYALGGQPVDRD
jgi:hypothetical protein